MAVALPLLDVAGWASGPTKCGWLCLHPSQMWLAGPSAHPKVAAKIKKWLHTCVQRVGVSGTLKIDYELFRVIGLKYGEEPPPVFAFFIFRLLPFIVSP